MPTLCRRPTRLPVTNWDIPTWTTLTDTRCLGLQAEAQNPRTRSNSNSNVRRITHHGSLSNLSNQRGTKFGVASMWANDSEACGRRTSR